MQVVHCVEELWGLQEEELEHEHKHPHLTLDLPPDLQP